MAGDQGEPGRRASDPVVTAAGEAAAAGYRGLENVYASLRESLRRSPPRFERAASARERTARASGRRAGPARTGAAPAAPAPAAHDAAPHSIVTEIADLTADMLDRLGEAAREIATHIAERDRGEAPADVPRLELQAPPGATAKVQFSFRNTGAVALKQVTFVATHLLGAGVYIESDAVRFEHEGKGHVERMAPGALTEVTVAVDIPDDAVPGTYRGVIAAGSPPPTARRAYEGAPVGAWALLELDVLATDAAYR